MRRVDSRVETLADRSRPTQAGAGMAGADHRRLPTTVWYPRAPGTSFPLVVFAHGLAGHPRKFSRLLGRWAAAGYVVAAPRFPLTADDVPGEPHLDDVVEQPADLRFVIDEVLRLGATPGHELAGVIDPDHLGVAGLSLGAFTALGVAYNSCCRDRRVDAVVAMAGALWPFPGDYDLAHPPLFLLHGDADEVVSYEGSRTVYARATAPTWFLTIRGGGHSEPFEDVDDPAYRTVADATIAFWDLHLKGDAGAADRLRDEASRDGVASLQVKR